MDVSRDTQASVDDVWAVIANGWTYGSWVVGAARIRAVDDNWPAAGAKFYHSVGLWPMLLDDSTSVIDSVPGKEIRLLARGNPIGRAEIHIRLAPTSAGCRIGMTERATTAPMNKVPERAQAASSAARNQECLRRLAYLAERSTTP